MKNNKLLIFLAIFIVVIFAVLVLNASKQSSVQTDTLTKDPLPAENEPPKIVSTKPNPLEEAIVGANEIIEITFNRSLENEGELKLKFEPKLDYKIDYKIELSQDRKTAKIIPLKPYELGSGYTLFIGPDTKFDGVGAWREEKIFHFRTIRYRGV